MASNFLPAAEWLSDAMRMTRGGFQSNSSLLFSPKLVSSSRDYASSLLDPSRLDYSTSGLQIAAAALTAVVLIITSASWLSYSGFLSSLPPGPTPWPILGNFPNLDALPYRSLARLADRFGPNLTVWLGSKPAVVISSPELAEEVLKTKDKFCAVRPLTRTVALLSNNGRFMATLPCNDEWRKQRRLAMMHLLSFRGIRKSLPERELELRNMLDAIAADTDAAAAATPSAAAAAASADADATVSQLKTGMNGLVKDGALRAADGGKEGLEIRRYLNLAAINSILQLTIGKRFSYDTIRAAAAAAVTGGVSRKEVLDSAMEIDWDRRIAAIRSGKQTDGTTAGAPSISTTAAAEAGESAPGASSATAGKTAAAAVDKSEGEKILALIEEAFLVGGAFNIADYVPCVSHLDPQGIYTRVRRLTPQLHGFMRACIEERRQLIARRSGEQGGSIDSGESRENRKDGEESRDGEEAPVFMDALLKMEGDGEENEVTEEEMMMLAIELIMAGTATTSKTVEWALAELAQHPDALARLQAEVDAAYASSATVTTSLSDADSDTTGNLPVQDMPYLQAVLKETFRHHPVAPFLARQVPAGNRVTLGGYTIPPETLILINTWALAHDPTVWIDPHKFNPARFLDPAAPDPTGKHFSLLPFGSGRRGCAGMNLGLDMSARMLAGFIRRFDFHLPAGGKTEGRDGEGVRLTAGRVNMREEFGLLVNMAEPLRIVCREREGGWE